MAKKDQQSSTGAIVGGIIGVAAAATAGAYFLYGTKKGKDTRKQIRGWALKAKGEILERMENLKEINEEAYHKVVDTVLKKYQSLKHVDSAELLQISKELKDHWKNIQKELEQGAKKVARVRQTIDKNGSNGNKSQSAKTTRTRKKSDSK